MYTGTRGFLQFFSQFLTAYYCYFAASFTEEKAVRNLWDQGKENGTWYEILKHFPFKLKDLCGLTEGLVHPDY